MKNALTLLRLVFCHERFVVCWMGWTLIASWIVPEASTSSLFVSGLFGAAGLSCWRLAQEVDHARSGA